MKKYTGIIILFLFLITHLLIINDYGLTWDFHFHFFGGGHLLGYSWQQLEPKALPYVEPDPRNAWSLPYGPIMSIPPVASFLLLKHILPPDSAYNLPIIFWGIFGIAIMYIFMKQAFSSRVAFLSTLFLALLPRYFGDMHNNMKDIPSATVFALNMWLLWRLAKFKRPIDLFWAIVAFALAFNVKINSIFIPMVFFVWLLIQRSFSKLLSFYFILAPVAAFLLWSAFWPHPFAQLEHAYRTFGIGTNNIEVLLNGAWYCSGSTVPWYYPFWYLAITTPLPILLFFFVGLFAKNSPTKLLLLLWLLLPLTRYLLPTVGVIDGIRHFEEILFPIAALAAIGLDRMRPIRLMNSLAIFLSFYLLFTIISYHPYQITYFNELVGGVKGAFGKYDLDYWGTSQKKAVEWVNAHAPKNAKVFIVMAPNVAGTYLRDDLLPNLNKFGYDHSDFVIILNRQSFFYRFFYVFDYLLTHKPIHTVSIHGTVLTWVFDNQAPVGARLAPWWQGEDPCIQNYWEND